MLCRNQTEFKAGSVNMGHEDVATTINSYLPGTLEVPMELFRNMGGALKATHDSTPYWSPN